MKWKMKDGNYIEVSDMTPEHAQNVLQTEAHFTSIPQRQEHLSFRLLHQLANSQSHSKHLVDE